MSKDAAWFEQGCLLLAASRSQRELRWLKPEWELEILIAGGGRARERMDG